MAKLPAFQFYPGDWRKDMGVQSLSFHDRGVWWEMLCLMHESERRGVLILNGQAMTEDSLTRLLGLDKQILTTTLTTLLTSGVASREEHTGAIYSRRMVRDENLRKIRTEAGSKGGNPVLLNQNTTTTVNQKSTPSSSSSLKTSNTKPKNSGEAAFVVPEWIPKEIWAAFVEMRNRIRAPMTETAKRGIVSKLEKLRLSGEDAAEVLNYSIMNSYRGVFALPSGNGHANGKRSGKDYDALYRELGLENEGDQALIVKYGNLPPGSDRL